MGSGLSIVRGGSIWTGVRHVDAVAIRDGLVVVVGKGAIELDGPNVATFDVRIFGTDLATSWSTNGPES